MTDGKLVRDLIPDIIRATGALPEVRHLRGKDLVDALGAKLVEEAQEAVEALEDRQQLIDELADVSEVMSTLMHLQGINHRDVEEAARTKAETRGRFASGAWLVSPVPSLIRRYRSVDVAAQRVKWRPERWVATFSGHEHAHADLRAHSEESGGIARRFIHARAQGDPVDLFLMSMAWGHRPKDYGPHRTKAVLDADGAEEKLAAIVEATRNDGAVAGWKALLATHKIAGLNMSFGTKLLYFAGYMTDHRPRPLVLDERVRASLQLIAPGTVPARGKVMRDDYLRYLDLAEGWASNHGWRETPDTVEYALFTG